MSAVLRFDRAPGVREIVLNRPEKGNAFDASMLAELLDMVERAGNDPHIRVLVLRGEGRHFCSGAEVGAAVPPVGAHRVRLIDVCHALVESEKPTVALVHGACIGGGLAFAACCDVVYAESNSVFALPEVRLGFAPRPLMPFLLRAMPARALTSHLLSGARFDVAAAQSAGLVHGVIDGLTAPGLPAPVRELLHGAPLAQIAIKRQLQHLAGGLLSRELTESLQRQVDLDRESPEAAEGRAAFREKRLPSWLPQ